MAWEMNKIQAAIRDPATGKIYSGPSHAHIIDDMEDEDNATAARLRKTYTSAASYPEAEHVGFIDEDGVFLNRKQSLKKFGVFDSSDLRRVLR